MRLLATALALSIPLATTAFGADYPVPRPGYPAPTPGPTKSGYPVTVTTNIPYGPLAIQKLDICKPNVSNGNKAPAVVIIHGGGWDSGDKKEYTNRLCPMYAAAGVIGAAINYRLVKPGPPPTNYWSRQLSDVQLAVRFLRSRLQNFSGKICATGDSAGAHLAIWLSAVKTTQPGDDMAGTLPNLSPAVDCAVGNSTPTDLTVGRNTPYGQKHVDALVNYSQTGMAGLIAASAVPYKIAPTNAPVYLTHGQNDPLLPLQQPQELVTVRQQNGLATPLTIYNGGHVFQWLTQAQKDQLRQAEIAWVISIIGHQ